jgi:hypothetical protein
VINKQMNAALRAPAAILKSQMAHGLEVPEVKNCTSRAMSTIARLTATSKIETTLEYSPVRRAKLHPK